VTDLTANEAEPRALEAGRHVATQLGRSLGSALVAAYLYGSALLGGFRWDRSDLDVLAVSRRALNDAEVTAIGGGLPGRFIGSGRHRHRRAALVAARRGHPGDTGAAP